ncbi:acyltransferase [Candidatus Curtissbacteria bacterium]|nr:acyltransferase [Candidatus Curtissbacteria bacterium]
MEKKLSDRQVELDVIKAVAIIAVVLVHTTSLSYSYFSRNGIGWNSLLVIDQLTRFCVPVFVGLSGYGLGIKNMDIGRDYRQFFRRRVVKLLPWYLFWSGIIYFYIRLSEERGHVEHYSVWKIIFMGKADYHLYFVPMIVSLYLIFPLMAILIKKFRWRIILFLGFLQTVLYFFTSLEAEKIIKLGFSWGDQQQYLFFGSWIFYFALGIYLNFLPGVMSKKNNLIKFAAIGFVVFGLVFILVDTFRLVGGGADIIAATRFTRIPVLIFATGFMLSSLVWRKFWLGFPRIFIWIGERSFIIYLSHTLILRELLELLKPNGLVNFISYFLLAFMLSTILAELTFQVARFLSKQKFYKLLIRF